MDLEQARTRLTQERAGLQEQLRRTGAELTEEHDAEGETGDYGDAAQPLREQGVDGAIASQLQGRLDAIERALGRVDDGTYGRSVRSGDLIPDLRLEADPAAELTVEEEAADEAAER